MTYAELLAKLQAMTDERLRDTVSVYDPQIDEYFEIAKVSIANKNNGVLDKDHLFLVMNK